MLPAEPRWRRRAGHAALLGALLLGSLLLRVASLQGLGSPDDRAALDNLHRFLGTPRLEHRPGLAPPLSYVPPALLLGLVDGLSGGRLSRTGEPVATAAGSSLLLLFPLLLGLGSLLAAYELGRVLDGRATGLLALLFLACSPLHLRASTSFGPDILLGFTATLALVWTLRALDRGDSRHAALLGLGLGLAASSRLAGLLLVPPCLGGWLLRWRGTPRSLRRLLLALGLGIVTFVLLDPHPGAILRDLLSRREQDLAAAAALRGSTFTSLVRGFFLPLHPDALGPVLGTLGLLWGGLDLFRCLFLLEPPPRRLARLVVLGTPLAFVIGFAAATPRFRALSFVPVLAAWAVLAARGAVAVTRRSMDLVPGRLRLVPAAGTALLALLLCVPMGARAVDRSPAASLLLDDWLAGRLEPGATLLTDGTWLRPGTPRVTLDPRDLASALGRRPPDPHLILLGSEHMRGIARRGDELTELYRDLILSPELRFVDRLPPEGSFPWRRFYVLARIGGVEGDWVLLEERALDVAALVVRGDGGIDEGVGWLRGEGATAAAPGIASAPGEALEVVLQAGADGSQLREPGAGMGLRIGVDGEGSDFDVDRDRLTEVVSGRLAAGGDSPRLTLSYRGGEGGRVYFRDLRLRRWAPRAVAAPGLLEKRSRELRLVERAAL